MSTHHVSVSDADMTTLLRLAAQDKCTPRQYMEKVLAAAIKIGSAGLPPLREGGYGAVRSAPRKSKEDLQGRTPRRTPPRKKKP